MKRILFLALTMLILPAVYTAESQVVGKYMEKKLKQATQRAGQKADQEITEEMNKKVDKAVENAFDSIFNDTDESDEKSTNQNSSGNSSDALSSAMMKSLGLNTSPANVAENYDYSGNIKMTVQSWDNNGETEGELDYITYMTESYSGFAMEFIQNGQHSVMIFDTKGGAMIILTESEGSKTGIVTAYAVDSLWDESDAETEEIEDYSIYNQNLKKTGRTKKIAGYSCDEYAYEDEESTGTAWMTNDLPAELWAKMFSANVIAASNVGYYGGFVMEMEQQDKETDEKVIMQVKEVNENQPKSFTTKGYQLISFGGTMGEDAGGEQE
jgi:hypothetical protein